MAEDMIEKVLARKKIEEQSNIIKRQNGQLESIIGNISDGLFMLNSNNEFTFLNQGGKDFFYQPDTITKNGDSFKHTKYYDIQGGELSVEEIIWSRVLKGEKVRQCRIRVVRPDKTAYFSLSGSPIYDKYGNISHTIICSQDITESIKSQIAIEATQKELLKVEKEKTETLKKAIEMKDEFISLISHEFKTPLTVINSAIQTMELICKNELSYKAKGFLNKIRQNSNRQLKLVNNLLDVTRINAGHLKNNQKNMDIVFLTKSITESIAIYAEQKSIRLSFSSTLVKKVIGIDEEKYERILLNLLSNAVKFTPEGKSVTVKVFQKIVKGKCKVYLQVRDKGVGIPHDKKKLIFERFGQVDSSLTRQSEGTGIGLTLVKMLVEILGGEITLESKEGMGCMFTIILPTRKVKGTPIEQIKEINDNRLIQATTIEFSGIYLK